MSVANKKRLSRVKGINWKKVILWTFNIVCYIITFIFTISLIIGSVKDSKTSNQHSTNSAIDINAKQQYGLVIGNDDEIILSGNEFNPRYYGTFSFENGNFSLPSFLTISFTYNDSFFEDCSFSFEEVDAMRTGLIYISYTYLVEGNDYIYTFVYFTYSSHMSFGDPFIADGYFTFDKFCYDDTDSSVALISSIELPISPSSYFPNTLYEAVYNYYYGNANEDIFDTIGDTIPSFVSTLNSGLTEAVTIFYDDGLTTIGYLSTIVVAVVLGYFSLRAVMGLVRLRG